MRQWAPTPEIIETILERLSAGDSLRDICSTQGLPSIPVFLRWVSKDSELADQYARARELQAQHYANEIVEISDTELDPNRARVRIDARKWVASKLLPKKYGDRQEIDVSGKVDLITVQVVEKKKPG